MAEWPKDEATPGEQSNAAALAALQPVLLRGLTWRQAHAALLRVDCAIRRDHWCSPVVILHEGDLTQDSDGDLAPFKFADDDRHARDWSMVARQDDNGNDVLPTYRAQALA